MDSGASTGTPFAIFDPDSCSWRTPQLSFDGDSTLSLAKWPRSGTTRNGHATARQRSALRITATDAGSLLPTPQASDSHRGQDTARSNRRGSGGPDLTTAVIALLPTPDASNFNDGQDSVRLEERLEKMKAKGYNGNGAGRTIGGQVAMLPTPLARDGKDGAAGTAPTNGYLSRTVRTLPTPTAMDGHGSRRSTAKQDHWTSKDGTTLTDAVYEMSSGPTRKQSSDGKVSWDEPPLPLEIPPAP